MHALSQRPPGHVVVGAARPANDEVRASSSSELAAAIESAPPAPRSRQMWLAGSIVAVAVAMLALVFVTTGRDKPVQRATAAPAEAATKPSANHAAPVPLERPKVVTQPVVAPAPEATAAEKTPADEVEKVEAEKVEVETPPAPAVKRIRKAPAKKSAPAKQPKKWDPDALFPR